MNKLKLPPRITVNISEMSKKIMYYYITNVSCSYPQYQYGYTSCENCKNDKWCRNYEMVFYTDVNPLDIAIDSPCKITGYEIGGFKGKFTVIVGICSKQCYMGGKEKLKCSYCPELDDTFCAKHEDIYFKNSYFKNNGVCCGCLWDFNFKIANDIDENEKVYMVQECLK